ncbi:hypothetical protein DD924_10660, partial [Staphylococcus pseudintermedius]
ASNRCTFVWCGCSISDNVSRATETVTFSYSLMDASGAEREKSPFLNDVRQMFRNLDIIQLTHQHARDT